MEGAGGFFYISSLRHSLCAMLNLWRDLIKNKKQEKNRRGICGAFYSPFVCFVYKFKIQKQPSSTTLATKLNRVVQRTIIGAYFEPEGTFVPNSKRSSQENTITIFACNQFDMEGPDREVSREKKML